MGQIILSQVRKAFGDVTVIPGVDLTIDDGEFETGTTIHLVTAEVDAGKVFAQVKASSAQAIREGNVFALDADICFWVWGFYKPISGELSERFNNKKAKY